WLARLRRAGRGPRGSRGARLAGRSRPRGHAVPALARPGAPRPADAGVHWIEGDLSDRDALARLVAGAEAVVHVAAVYRTAGHPDSYYRDVNVGGTERLLDKAARAGGSRFVHTSTRGAHGHVRRPPAD